MRSREEARLRAGIIAAIEAFQDGDPAYALEVLLALDDAPAKGVGCSFCSLTFRWPGLRDEHVRVAHWETEAEAELEQAA